MNYLFLKNIISTLVSDFVCPSCHLGRPKEEFLVVNKISNSFAEIIFTCPHCKTKNILRAEAAPIDVSTTEGAEFFKKIMKEGKRIVQNKKGIPTEEIQKIEAKLTNNITVTELINEE